MPSFHTTGEIAAFTGVPEWRVRRVVDRAPIDVQRAGRYRLVSADQLAVVLAELNRKKGTPEREVCQK